MDNHNLQGNIWQNGMKWAAYQEFQEDLELLLMLIRIFFINLTQNSHALYRSAEFLNRPLNSHSCDGQLQQQASGLFCPIWNERI